MVDPPFAMDEATTRVRDLYEAYSYPPGPPVMRCGFDPRLLLSYGALERDALRRIHVLDAGCGRGAALLAAASLQPDVHFFGVDMNRVGLSELEREAESRGLVNITTAEVDLMTMEGLASPPGGFDVIHCSGVIHHLTEPAEGLARLAQELAPHGILSLMVYSKRGRDHIHPIARALNLLAHPGETLEERLRLGRRLVEDLAQRCDDKMWSRARDVNDVEFVDRYLHPQETSYDVDSLWDLLHAAGLRFLRWAHHDEWESVGELCSGQVRERYEALAPRERYRFAQELLRGGKLQLYACLTGNAARPEFDPADVELVGFAVHPEGTFELVTRSVRGASRIERLTWRGAMGDEYHLPQGPVASAGLILRDQNLAFDGKALIEALTADGVERTVARGALVELVRRGILYRPHAADMPIQEAYRPAAAGMPRPDFTRAS